MEVTIERGGGFFPGAARPVRLHADALGAVDRERLERLVSLASMASNEEGAAGPDAFRYTIIVEGAGEPRRLLVNEATASSDLRALLHWAVQLRPE